MDNENTTTSKTAIKRVIDYEKSLGNEVIDAQNVRNLKGFDLISISNDKKSVKLIEVKGTKTENAIPDFFETEFTRQKRLIATHLYIVHITQDNSTLHIIESKNIKPEYVEETRRYRIKSKYQKELLKNSKKV